MKRALAIAAIFCAPASAFADDDPALEPSADQPATDAKHDEAKPTDTKPEVDAKATAKKPGETEKKSYELTGYIQPAFSVVYRGKAVPRDRWRYGAEETRAGIILEGEPLKKWHYRLEAVLAGEANDLVTSVSTVDTNGDGIPDDVSAMTKSVPGVFIERAVIEYEASKRLSIVAGRHRIPFTVQEQSPSTELMFPQRSGPNEVFVQGPDLGLEAVGRLPDDLVIAHVGAFNGTGEPVDVKTEHGLTYSARVDFNPLGAFPISESNIAQGPPRLGLGAGILYYESRSYDTAGYPGASQRDLRASVSARAAVSNFYIQSELLRRQRTDSLSNRPEITTGAYAQASFLIDASIGISPQARVGWADQDEGFMPRTTVWFEGGVALFPSLEDLDAARILIVYRGERRITEAEQANGVAVQAQLEW